MSMSHEMVKAYIKQMLVEAVSTGGTIIGETASVDGHTHKFSIVWDEGKQQFVGETSFDGYTPHRHLIFASLRELANTTSPQPRSQENIADVPEDNMSARLRELLEIYNQKEVTLQTGTAFEIRDDHTHTLTMRFAGHETGDKTGRTIPTTAKTIFGKGLEEAAKDPRLEEAKKRGEEARKKVKDSIKKEGTCDKHKKE